MKLLKIGDKVYEVIERKNGNLLLIPTDIEVEEAIAVKQMSNDELIDEFMRRGTHVEYR